MNSTQQIETPMALVEERNTAKTVTIGILTAAFVIAAPIIIGAAGGNYWVRVLDF
ncbi:ABC transporter ATP-binding protein, partial [Burkholderia sp. Ac-20353]|nr:ABC transporter ATP-binding protein [Burkholderia sp. Ac-20353]